MKRIFSKYVALLISFIMIIGICASSIAALANAAPINNGIKLPKIGETISGFEVTEIEPVSLLNANSVKFKHTKTGVELVWLANEDQNRAFSIGFRSYPESDNGANHILEHSVISASKKYPAKNLFFALINQTYNTFLNAQTFPSFLQYPASSGDDNQLLALEDAYLSLLFESAVMDDISIFEREGWRYELESLEAPLIINGTVHNEMTQGYSNIVAPTLLELRKSLFPNSKSAFESGGVPNEIAKLTFEELVDTYNNVYHPRNSFPTLYGDIDLNKHLTQIDGYLTKFDKGKEPLAKEAAQNPLAEPAKIYYDFPTTIDAQTNNKSMLLMGFAIQGLSQEDALAMKLLASYLNNNELSFQTELNKSGIGTAYGVEYTDGYAEPLLLIMAVDADEKEADAFKAVVLEQLSNIVKNGLDKKVLSADLAMNKMNSLLTLESSVVGVNCLTNVIYDHYINGNHLNSLNSQEIFNDLEKKLEGDYFTKLIDDKIIKNNWNSLVVSTPKAGLTETENAKLAKQLQEVKDGMTAEEKQALIDKGLKTKEFLATDSKEEAESMAKIAVTKPTDLSTKVQRYQFEDTTENGVRYIKTPIQVEDLTDTLIMLDLSTFSTIEELCDLKLYNSMIGSFEADGLSALDLGNKLKETMTGINSEIRYTTTDYKTGKGYPALRIGFMALEENYNEAVDIWNKLLFKTDFLKDIDTLMQQVDVLIYSMNANLISGSFQLAYEQATAGISEGKALSSFLSGPEYLKYLTKIKKELAKNPQTVIDRLTNAQNKLSSNNAVVAFTGNKEHLETKQAQIAPILANLNQETPKNSMPASIKTFKSNAIAVLTNSNANAVAFDRKNIDPSNSGVMEVLLKAMEDKYLIPELRFNNGAYSAASALGNDFIALISGSDPKIDESFDIFNGFAEKLSELTLSQKELDSYKINAYSSIMPFAGIYSSAKSGMLNYISGQSFEQQDLYLQQLLNASLEDIKAYAPLFEKEMANMNSATISSKEKIEKSKIKFKKITDVDAIK